VEALCLPKKLQFPEVSIWKWAQIQTVCKLACAHKPYICTFICAIFLSYLHQWTLCTEDRGWFLFFSEFPSVSSKEKNLWIMLKCILYGLMMLLTSSPSFQAKLS